MLDDVDLAWHGDVAEQPSALYASIGAVTDADLRGVQRSGGERCAMGVDRRVEGRGIVQPQMGIRVRKEGQNLDSNADTPGTHRYGGFRNLVAGCLWFARDNGRDESGGL